jgi:hypothetical protein
MKIIYTQDDGTIAVIHPAPNALKKMSIEQIARKDVPAGKEYRIIPDDAIPGDREFRNAWRADLARARVTIDAPAAVQILVDRLRVRRNTALDRLDKDAARAADQGLDGDLAAIRQRKQVLRDLPSDLTARAAPLVAGDDDPASVTAKLKAIDIPIAEAE